MTAWLPRWFALLWLVIPFVPVIAVAPDDQEIERRVKQLGSDQFAEREAASKRLEAIGEPALDALHRAVATSGDPEVRCRAERIIRATHARLLADGQDPTAKDLEKLQGEWSVVRSERDGKLLAEKVRQTLRVRIRGRALLLTGSDGEVINEDGLFTLDTSHTPKAIDFRDDLAKKVNRGIFLLDKERLTICIDLSGKERPTSFSSKDGRSLLVLQRARPQTEEDRQMGKALAAIHKLGGKTEVDEKRPGRPVVAVDFSHCPHAEQGLAHLKSLTGLQKLDLLGTEVADEGLVHLKGLTGLRELNLVGTRVTDRGLVHLKEVPHLRTLYLNSPVTDAGLVHLRGLTKLRVLQVSIPEITDAGLAHLAGLTRLRKLYLTGTQVSGSGLRHLQGMSQLQTLILINTRVSDAGLAHLRGVPRLQTLALGGTEVTDAGLVHLKKLTSLRDLQINQITDAGLVHLQRLDRLERLNLRATRITDAGLAYLEKLTRLRSLDLAGTKVTDKGLAHLERLSLLRTIDLQFTEVTDAGIESLKQALPGAEIRRTQWIVIPVGKEPAPDTRCRPDE